MTPVQIIAHRGYSEVAPENTLAALRLALEAGAPALEWDVHVTRDGVPVVIHDDDVRRTTNGRGAVRNLTLDEVRALDAGSWFDPAFAGERVPTLREALALARGRCEQVYPELKGCREPADIDRIVEILREEGWEDDAVLISMERPFLERARQASSRLGLGCVEKRESGYRSAVRWARADGNALVDARASLLLGRPRLIDEAHAAGVELAVWTVDDVATATTLVARGVRRITTNRVELLLRAGLGATGCQPPGMEPSPG